MKSNFWIETNAEVKKLIKKSGGIAELIRCLKEGGDLRKLALTVIGFVISKDGLLRYIVYNTDH